ncbi:DoxX family protein [Rubrobacter aplysinae]|uniref:DoxX family protein n=1 Tax=Rubrobacter aplysinae TaxID=909625 RepID=UPI00064C27EB|nr:DoxX family protein [Rubrobacter aplysinae]
MVDLALLLLRALLALVFVSHGAQKLVPGVGGSSPGHEAWRFEQAGIRPAREMSLLTGVLQLGAGALVLLGLLTPLAAFVLGATMVVAALRAHDGRGFFIQNGGYEYNVALAVVSLALILAGAGSYSLDAALGLFW